MFGAAAWYDRVSVVSRAADAAGSTTHALAEHGEAVMQIAALALDLQLGRVEGMSWPEIGESEPVHQFLVGLTKQLPQLQSAFFVDPQGFNSASSREFPTHPYDDREREYFRAAAHGATDLIVSAPFRGKAAGTVGFVVARARMNDGRFDGLAAVTLSPEYFRNFYESVLRWHDNAAATLLRQDGTVLVRYPASTALPPVLPASSTIMLAIAVHPAFGLGETRSVADGRIKIYAYRRLPQSGLFVAYLLDRQQVLVEWYQHLGIFAAFAVLASAALLLAARRAMQDASRQRADLHALLDETERRQRAELALQQAGKMEALGRLTGGVAHDFNNLLAAVLGSLELALRRVEDARVVRQLTVARQAAEKGARLTSQMLAFARKQVIERRPIDANELIRGIDELLRRAAGAAVRIEYDLQERVWGALADPVQLELALLNLVTNSRDALPDGGQIIVRTRNIPWVPGLPDGLAPGDYVLIAVDDSGLGMPEEVRRNAFEPFFTTKGPGRGTGLGLSMVYGFARQLDGTAVLDSAPGHGTTVSLYLPRMTGEALAKQPGAIVPGSPLSVLLVDDDREVRNSVREMLTELGHHVTEAEGGAHALELLGDMRFDVLIVDFVMPDMNGAAVVKAARQAASALPVIFMTGYAGQGALRDWSERGYHVMHKPFDLARLAEALRAVIGAEARG